MTSKRVIRFMTLAFLISAFASILYPELSLLTFVFLLVSQAYLFFHAEVFSGQTKGNAKWRTYRFLLFFVLCVSMSFYYLSRVIQDETLRMDNSTLFIFMLMVVFGNLAPKIPFNRTLGFRLPWTLSDQATWRYAHRIVGYTSFLCAFLLLFAHLMNNQILYHTSILCWFMIPSIRSYQYHMKHHLIHTSRRTYLMKYKEPVFYVRLLFLLCIIATILLFPFLPNDLPMQFSASGEANWTMPKIFGVLMIPAIVLFLQAYYKQQTNLDISKACFLSLLLIFDIGFLAFVAFVF